MVWKRYMFAVVAALAVAAVYWGSRAPYTERSVSWWVALSLLALPFVVSVSCGIVLEWWRWRVGVVYAIVTAAAIGCLTVIGMTRPVRNYPEDMSTALETGAFQFVFFSVLITLAGEYGRLLRRA